MSKVLQSGGRSLRTVKSQRIFGGYLFSNIVHSRTDWCKNDHRAAFCDEELKSGIVTEEAMKSKTGYRAKYYRS